MKIVHICLANFYIDDYSYQENILPKYHKKLGLDVAIIASNVSFDSNGKQCLLEPSEKSYLSGDNIPVVRLKYKSPFFFINKTLRRYSNFSGRLNEIKPDIIFVHGCQFLDIVVIRNYKKRHPHVKIYIDNHADYVNSARNWLSLQVKHKIIWRYCAKTIEKHVEKFWGVSPVRSQFLRDVYKINPGLIDTLFMGIDLDAAQFNQREQIRNLKRAEFGFSASEVILISGGKIDELKNIDLLVSAFKKIDLYNLRLIIFGNIKEEIKDEYLDIFKSDNRIEFVGWCSPSEIYNLFYMCDLACFPGTHSVLWEQAIGLGLPIIIRKWNGFQHLEINESVIPLKSSYLLEQIIRQTIPVLDHLKRRASENHLIFSYEELAKKAIDMQ